MNTVADPDPNPTIGGWGQLPDPNECNSTLTSETSRETLIPDPNECHFTLMGGGVNYLTLTSAILH